MKRTPWYSPFQVPARRGWYERDHRNVRAYLDEVDKRIWLDLWEPVRNKNDILYPGVWYVWEAEYGLNDASHQKLPWRGLAEQPKEK